MANVRVRGIIATAVSKILFDQGYTIVQASKPIQERLGIDFDTSPAEVTVKDADNDEILVIGSPKPARQVYELLVETLEDVFTWRSRLGLWSIVSGVVTENNDRVCRVKLPLGLEGELFNCRKRPGETIIMAVARPPVKPGEKIRLTTNIRIIGKYVALIHGTPKLTASEHIRDKARREYLLALAASKVFGKGVGVHLRSSSMYASEEDIRREIDELMKKLDEILHMEPPEKPTIIYPGEYLGLIGLTSTAKERLDEIRNQVVPTITGHHSLKSTHDQSLSELVDYTEYLVQKQVFTRENASRSIRDYILEKNREARIGITHIKPTGEKLHLTLGTMHEVKIDRDSTIIIVKRTMHSKGVYDGLDIEKKPGDVDYMFIKTGEWWISHNYYRGEEWLGTYVNINTPPELLPREIKYHDLVIDVVITNTKTQTIDEEELEQLVEQGIIPEKLARKAQKTAQKIKENPENHIYNPNTRIQ